MVQAAIKQTLAATKLRVTTATRRVGTVSLQHASTLRPTPTPTSPGGGSGGGQGGSRIKREEFFSRFPVGVAGWLVSRFVSADPARALTD